MKKEELYREIGLIDEQLIEAAEHSGVTKRKKQFSKMWVALIACLMLYSSTATVLLAMNYYKGQNEEELYIRYLYPENMELEDVRKYDPEKFLQALKSDNETYIYIAINRLVESFNNESMREKALRAIQPFVTNENEKIADAAAFAVDILSQSYQNPNIYSMADGSKVFTLFHNYSDYGSQNVIWRIQDNKLEKIFSYSEPSMYIREIVVSPDQKLLAVITNSNKSEFLNVINVEEGMTSPELLESARVKHGAQKEIPTWIRIDHENYSYVLDIAWSDNDTLQFEGSLAYENTAIIEAVEAEYHYNENRLEVQEVK